MMTARILLLVILWIFSFDVVARDPFLLPEARRLGTACYAIQYASAPEIAKKISNKAYHFLSERGYVISDKATNYLWVYDDADRLGRITRFIHALDRVQPQIFIKAVIAVVDRQSLQQLGSYLEEQETNDHSISHAVQLPLIKIENQHLFTVALTALERNGHVNIISEPELITLNRKKARIAAGDEIPYQQKAGSDSTSTSFKKAVLQLQVTPTVLPDNKIRLALDIRQDKPERLQLDGVPAIKTQRLITEVMVKNRQTVVLGGIHEESRVASRSGVPVLQRIPVLGWLFKNSEQQHKQQQLLIFITPHILGEPK